ncbi:recombinase family protein [Salmonella enterica subsp. enterica serovar Newport]|nr:recombinase family protein [Salmonella enterica subsp. enterica serovar Newport]
MRTFIYCRVSTTEQDTANQLHAIKSRMGEGFEIRDDRIFDDVVSGGSMANNRPNFKRMLDRLEKGDKVIVLKLDRLGRDLIDILQTVKQFKEMGVQIISLDIATTDLNLPENKTTMGIMAVLAEREKDRIRERTQEALARIKAEGKTKLGRPEATDTTKAVQECKAAKLSQRETATRLDISLPTVKRHWNK